MRIDRAHAGNVLSPGLGVESPTDEWSFRHVRADVNDRETISDINIELWHT